MIREGKLEDLEQVNVIRKQVNDLHVKGEPTVFKGFVPEIANYVKEFINNPNKYKKYRINNTGIVEEYPLNMFTSVEQLSGEILSIRFKEE